MNIIDFLIAQHDKLRNELVQIRKHLHQKDLNEKLNQFVSEFELHESIEEQFLYPEVSGLYDQETHGENTINFEEAHTLIWKQLKQLIQTANSGQHESSQQAYFKFDALLESHMSAEDRVLFPLARQSISESVLEDLGEKAVKYAEQYRSSSKSGAWNPKIIY